MKIELNEQECHNVRVALRKTMKQPELNEESMKNLLMLSDKFIVKPVIKKKIISKTKKQ